MKTTFRYEHLDRSEALENVITEKLQQVARIVAAYDVNDAVKADVDLAQATAHHHGDVFTLRITVAVEGETFTAEATGDTAYAIVDDVVGKLHSAVQRFKEHDVARQHARD